MRRTSDGIVLWSGVAQVSTAWMTTQLTWVHQYLMMRGGMMCCQGVMGALCVMVFGRAVK